MASPSFRANRGSKNDFAWANGGIGKHLNDHARVVEIYQEIAELRQYMGLNLVWVPRHENLVGIYLEEIAGA